MSQIHDDVLDPVDYVAIEFPDGDITAEGFIQLRELVDHGAVQVLDLEFVTRRPDGTVAKVAVGELVNPEHVDVEKWGGLSSGILDASDVDEIGSAIQPGSVAMVVVYENRWLESLTSAWRRRGARLISDGGIPAEDLVAALEATEPRVTDV